MVAIRNHRSVSCEIVTDFAHFESMEAEWSRLWSASPRSEIFQTFGWARSYWKAFGRRLSLFAPVVYRGSEVLGILPLGLAGNVLHFWGAPLFDYNDVICADESVGEVMRTAIEHLLDAREHWANAVLDNVPAQGRIVRHLAQLQQQYDSSFQTVFKCPCLTIANTDGDVFARLQRKSHLRWRENKLRRLGRELVFAHLECREEIVQSIGGFFQQHLERRAMLGELSMFQVAENRTFIEALVEELDPRSELRFAVLRLDGRTVAYHLGFQGNGKFVSYQPVFDINYLHHSPGEVMLRNLLQYASEQKLREFDFTTGGENYKHRFATLKRDNLTVHFSPERGLRRYFELRAYQVNGSVRKAREVLRKYERIYAMARSVARWLRRERRLIQHSGARYAIDAGRRMFRNFVFARDSSMMFHVTREDAAHYAGPREAVSLSPASLSDLAVASIFQPELAPRLDEWEERLEAGQQLWMIRDDSNVAQIWAVSPAEKNVNQKSCAPESTLVVQQCWTARSFRKHGLFGALVRGLVRMERTLLVHCPENDPVTKEIRSVGLKPSHRYTYLRFLHRFRYLIVSPCLPAGPQFSKRLRTRVAL
jgi:CelD/BcsL family acetyltransferase involved in cellulose biosynthesis